MKILYIPDHAWVEFLLRDGGRLHRLHLRAAGVLDRSLVGAGPAEDRGGQTRNISLHHDTRVRDRGEHQDQPAGRQTHTIILEPV